MSMRDSLNANKIVLEFVNRWQIITHTKNNKEMFLEGQTNFEIGCIPDSATTKLMATFHKNVS